MRAFRLGIYSLLLFSGVIPSSLAQWVAFNDHAAGSETHSNATHYHTLGNGSPASGPLRNIANGTNLPVQMAITRSASGVVANSSAARPAGGTPLSLVFNGFVDFIGSPDPSIEVAGSGVVTYTFSNLNTSRVYRFHGSSIRGSVDYTNRWALCEISGATRFVPAHSSSNVLTTANVPSLAGSQAALDSGVNHTAATGDYVSWDKIQPGPNGTFAVTCRQYVGSVPGGTSGGAKGYALTGFRLEELSDDLQAVAIASQPTGQTLFEGQTVSLTADATGNPLYYQWLREGVPISAATNRVFSIQCATRDVSGNYSFIVSNALGYVSSSNAVVSVVVPPIIEWGRNEYGQVNVPLNLSNVVMMAAGSWHGLALQGNGKVIGWGRNDFGQINVPVDVQAPAAIAAGFYWSMALLSNRTVRCWGDNAWGQCNVPLGLTNVVMIAPGYDHALVLKGDGTVSAWGRNSFGQLNVPAGLSNVVKVCAGGHQSLALQADGTVRAWGAYDGAGAVYVPPNLTNVVSLAAANLHTMALSADGSIVAWGSNVYGQTNVPSAASNVIAIAGGNGFGGSHSVALKPDGTIALWGFNNFNQSVPLPCLAKATAIAAGEYYTMLMNAEDATVSGPVLLARPFVMGAVARPLHQRFVIRNGPATFRATGLPGGVTLDSSSGLLGGWPNAVGDFLISLSVSNSAGSIERTFHLIVLPNADAPIFNQQPPTQNVVVGSSLKLQAVVTGLPPLTYQWYFNGVALEGATGPKLILSSVQAAQAGYYSVFVTSAGGSLWSDTAHLVVLEPPQFLQAPWIDLGNQLFRATIPVLDGYSNIVLETSTNLLDWQPIYTNEIPGTTWEFTNALDPDSILRAYRLKGL